MLFTSGIAPACCCWLQGAPAGKLLSYNPKTKEVHVLAKDFYYANGVALSADESYLVMVETDRIRTIKFWLKGEKVGVTPPPLPLSWYPRAHTSLLSW